MLKAVGRGEQSRPETCADVAAASFVPCYNLTGSNRLTSTKRMACRHTLPSAAADTAARISTSEAAAAPPKRRGPRQQGEGTRGAGAAAHAVSSHHIKHCKTVI